VDLCTRKEFTEGVCKLSHKVFVQGLSTLGISVVKTVINGLRNDVIEFLKELLSALFIESGILNESEGHKIGGNPVQKELLMLFKLRLRITNLANDVPEGIRDERVSMLEVKQI
jgi:hypothetical protein